MRMVPIFLAVKRPGQFDTDGIIPLALRHIIARGNYQETRHRRRNHPNRDPSAKRHKKRDGVDD